MNFKKIFLEGPSEEKYFSLLTSGAPSGKTFTVVQVEKPFIKRVVDKAIVEAISKLKEHSYKKVLGWISMLYTAYYKDYLLHLWNVFLNKMHQSWSTVIDWLHHLKP